MRRVQRRRGASPSCRAGRCRGSGRPGVGPAAVTPTSSVARRGDVPVDRELASAASSEPARLHVRRWDGGACSSSARRSRIATRRSPACSPRSSSAGRSRCCSRRGRLCRSPAPRCGRSRRCAAARARSRRNRRAAGCRCPPPTTRSAALGETLNAMLDRLDEGLRARAPLRRRREPRAAHAARLAPHRARARAAPAAEPEELRGALALGRRGGRAARAARRGPARARPARTRAAATPARADRCRRPARSRGAAASPRARTRAGRALEVDAPPGLGSTATGCASSRRSGTSSTTRCGTAPGTSACAPSPARASRRARGRATRARASRPTSCRARSSPSAAWTTRAAERHRSRPGDRRRHRPGARRRGAVRCGTGRLRPRLADASRRSRLKPHGALIERS